MDKRERAAMLDTSNDDLRRRARAVAGEHVDAVFVHRIPEPNYTLAPATGTFITKVSWVTRVRSLGLRLWRKVITLVR